MTFSNSQELKDWSRAAFVSNECETDQYRETQPRRTIDLILDILASTELGPRLSELVMLANAWVTAAGFKVPIPESVGYEGCIAAHPLYEAIHDILWDSGKHPYYESEALLREAYNSDIDSALENQADNEAAR